LLSLLNKSTKTIRLTEEIYNRAKKIDDKLIKKGTINFTKLDIKVANPLNWLQEVL